MLCEWHYATCVGEPGRWHSITKGGFPLPLQKLFLSFLAFFPLLLAIILSCMAKSSSQMACVARPWCAAVSHLPQPIKEFHGHCLSLQSLQRTHSPGSSIFTPLPFSVEPVQEKSPGMLFNIAVIWLSAALSIIFFLIFFSLRKEAQPRRWSEKCSSADLKFFGVALKENKHKREQPGVDPVAGRI